MMNITLRLLEPSDFLDLHMTCWPDQLRDEVEFRLTTSLHQLQKSQAWPYIAMLGDQIVGFGQLIRWGMHHEITDLVVAENWRGQGIGSALIDSLIDIARQHGIDAVQIGAAFSNPRALDLYRRLGFQDWRRQIMDVGQGLELVIFLRKEVPDSR